VQQKMMALWKENKVSPVSGCLPMLVQIPVFIGFFMMVRSAIELRGAQFLWAMDLASPDTIFYLPGLNIPVNPLSILMGITMFFQARMTPMSPGMDPAQAKMMKYMPLMFLVLLYNYSAGLTLYWTTQNLLTIAQMKLTRPADKKPVPAPVPVNPAPKKKK
jgi:YidC/Oxa1 family membrane protein insertase